MSQQQFNGYMALFSGIRYAFDGRFIMVNEVRQIIVMLLVVRRVVGPQRCSVGLFVETVTGHGPTHMIRHVNFLVFVLVHVG
jgi:hypothetical protein